MLSFRIIFCCILMVTGFSHASELKPFATDGCSMWIDGPPEYPNLWRHCCVLHDLAYWQGGSKEQRQIADKAIKTCVWEAAESKGLATYMHSMIRMGGSPYWLSSYRWGFGWNYWDGFMKPRGYKIPTAKEQQKLNQLLPAALQLIAEDEIQNPRDKEVEMLVRLLKK